MRSKELKRVIIISSLVAILSWTSQSSAQIRPLGRIAGIVRDQNGALILAGNVKVSDEATHTELTTTLDAAGGFAFPDLLPGSYTVIVAAPGFSTKAISGVKVEIGRTADVSVTLEVGNIEEMVQVNGGSAAVERSETSIGKIVSGDEIRSLPLNNRDAIDFVLLTPGAQQIGLAKDSSFLGLPKAAINVTMDGLNDQLNRDKSIDPLSPVVRPRLDAIEEVSVTTTVGGANLSGDGAIQIQFVTRRGTNNFRGKLFWDHRNDALSANTWFNNAAGIPRARNLLNVFGGNVGGPILKNKLFFFANYEEFHWPLSVTNGNLILTREAASGVFRYRGTDGVERAVNLLQVAGAAGFPSTLDPINADMLRQIDSLRDRGIVSSSDLIRDRFQWVSPSDQVRRYPIVRMDYQINPNIHWQGVWQYQRTSSFPDVLNGAQSVFPGIGGDAGQYSKRYSLTTALQWMLRPTVNNEFRFGMQRLMSQAWPESGPEIYPRGFRIRWQQLNLQSLDSIAGGTNSRALAISTDAPTYNIQDNLSWLREAHSFSFGGGLSLETTNNTAFNSAGIPNVMFGVGSGDPVANALVGGLPKIAAGDQTNALALYALLTGRITSISGSRNVDQNSKRYLNLAPLVTSTHGSSASIYFQDSWRIRPNLTLNYGLGWQFQGAYSNTNGIFTSPTFEALWGVSGVGNLFQPGASTGIVNPQIDLRPDNLYRPDYFNPAPSFGFAWSPKFRPSLLKRIFGSEDKAVIRAGYSIAYAREGDAFFSQFAGGSPGLTQSISLNAGTDFTAGSLLLRNPLPAFQEFPKSFSFPTPQSFFTFSGATFATIDPNLRAPYVQSWSIGWQRELNKDMALEARYVANHGVKFWRSININEVNIFENGFLNEFKNAQRNLAISRAAGVTNFANRGLAGQVALPIFEAGFGARGSQPALGAAQGFANAGFINLLDQGQAGAFANTLASQANFLCRLTGNRLAACAGSFNAAGPFAPNFFQANPDGAGNVVGYLTNGTSSTHNGLQLELRRRMSKGLMLNTSYTFSKSLSNTALNGDVTLRDQGLSKTPSPFDIRHSFIASWVYEFPFGPGRRWKTSNAILNKLIEGWNFLGIARVQSGRPFRLTSGGRQTVNSFDAGVVLRGLTLKQLQRMIGFREVPGVQQIFFVDPGLIGSDNRANHAVLDYPTTPGEFGSIIFLHSPHFARTSLTLSKKTRISERLNIELWADFFNAFNNPNFLINQTVSIDSPTFGRTTNSFTDFIQNQDAGPRMIQFRMRLNF